MTTKTSTVKRWRYFHPDARPNADPVFIVEADTEWQSIEVRTSYAQPVRLSRVLDGENGSISSLELIALIDKAHRWLAEQATEDTPSDKAVD